MKYSRDSLAIRASRWTAALLTPVVLTLFTGAWAEAQSGGDGFLFKPPAVSLTLHGGFAGASAGSDIFSDVTEQLTLDRGDFGGLAGGGTFAVTVAPRVELSFGASYLNRTVGSEFRDWTEPTEGGEEIGIEQKTTFTRVPVMASAKVYLTPRGRSIGSFGWIPARVAPYVGAGAGGMWYRFRQVGDFVNFQTLNIFWDEIESDGWAPAAQAFAGVDYTLTPRLALVGEARYLRGEADLDSRRYAGFEPIDLSGVSASVGISLRF